MLLVGLIYFYTLLVNEVKKYSNTTTYFYQRVPIGVRQPYNSVRNIYL